MGKTKQTVFGRDAGGVSQLIAAKKGIIAS